LTTMGSDVMLQDGVSMRIELTTITSHLLHRIPLQPFNVLPGQRGIEHGLDVLGQRFSTCWFTVNVRFLDNVVDIR